MRLGILDMISLIASLIFAIPVGNFGLTKLLAGETVMGVALIVVAVAMVAVPHYFMDPQTIATKLVKGLLPSRFQADPSVDDGENPQK